MIQDFKDAVFLNYSFERRSGVPLLKRSLIPYLDLTLCIEGRMVYTIDGERVILEGGDAIIFPPGSVREREETDEKNYYASFNVQLSGEYTAEIRGKVKNCVFSDSLTMLDSFKRIFLEPSLFKEEKCRSIFSYVFHQIIEVALDNENPYVKRTKQYVASHLSEPISLKALAEAVHLEPHYLCALFKAHTEVTVMQYIIFLRIEKAKHLIITGDDKICNIAALCGFANYNHFSVTFKKITGMTPADYRSLVRL
jgi:YesN/AraC family two-component response regulator